MKDGSIFSQPSGFLYNCPIPWGSFFNPETTVWDPAFHQGFIVVMRPGGWCGFPVFNFWKSQRQLLGIESWQNYCPASLPATAHKTPPTSMNFMANSVNRAFEEAHGRAVGILFCYLKKSPRLFINILSISFYSRLCCSSPTAWPGTHGAANNFLMRSLGGTLGLSSASFTCGKADSFS